MRRHAAIAIALTIAALGFRLFLVLHLPNDDDDDGHFYAQIARNLLDHRGYSGEEEEPYVPTYVRVPGYPLFLAGVYSVFGRDNNTAVRIIQSSLDTATCWLVALLALAWVPIKWKPWKRRRAMLIALALAAACPFTAIYTTTILTETWATLLVTGFVLVATFASKSDRTLKSALLWMAAGILGGAATMFRPDCALFAGGSGVTLFVAGFVRAIAQLKSPEQHESAGVWRALGVTLAGCVALSIGFISILAPWGIRNARVFGVFQPVAPAYAVMPDEFAPMGYVAWLRTWVDDERYVSAIEDGIDLYPIPIERIPDYAYDSSNERDLVQALLDRYNNPLKPAADPSDEDNQPPAPAPAVKMTPSIDAEFGLIARERIARHPLRYYILLPLKRAQSLWFDTHSQYYPFQGQLFPLTDLDTDAHQQYWLPLFAALTWFYTISALIGVWVLWKSESSRRWVWLLAMLIVPRLVFLAAQEHPETRYTVEFFPLVAAAGSLALAHLTFHRIRRGAAATISKVRTLSSDV